MPREVEKVTPYSLPHGLGHVRVWRKQYVESLAVFDQDEDVENLIHEFYNTPGTTLQVLADHIATLPRVNAVEVTDRFGRGIVIYPDWP